MTYRTDKFAVGDKVVWSKSHRDQAHWIVDEETWSEGPFTVVVVIDRPYDPPNDEFKQSNYDGMGHTQHVRVHELRGEWSGVYFTKEGI